MVVAWWIMATLPSVYIIAQLFPHLISLPIVPLLSHHFYSVTAAQNHVVFPKTLYLFFPHFMNFDDYYLLLSCFLIAFLYPQIHFDW